MRRRRDGEMEDGMRAGGERICLDHTQRLARQLLLSAAAADVLLKPAPAVMQGRDEV